MNTDGPRIIAQMFQQGFSLDAISERGLSSNCKWTRLDATRVVRDNDWALDWSGRLQARFRLAASPVVADEKPSIGEADLERMLAVGIDHEVHLIRTRARKASEALDSLRTALVEQEETDRRNAAKRAEIRAMEVEQRQTQAAEEINHGEWSGYRVHILNGIPLCGPCEAAGALRMMKLRQASAASRRSSSQAS
jgi:hypothetical protein